MEEEMQKVAEEEKKLEEPKVAKRLQAENNEFEGKIVSSAQKQAKSIERAKASGDAVDFVPPELSGMIGEEAARKLNEPVDAPEKKESEKAWVPPELAGALSLA